MVLNEAIDRSMFAAKRRDQIDTANRILGMEEYSKQYKMVELLMETIFPVSVYVCK